MLHEVESLAAEWHDQHKIRLINAAVDPRTAIREDNLTVRVPARCAAPLARRLRCGGALRMFFSLSVLPEFVFAVMKIFPVYWLEFVWR